MIELYNTVLYEPILNLLVFFYNIIPGNDIGLAIIALTVLVKLVLLPFSFQSIKSQKAMQDIQPKLEALKKEFKDDKEKLAAETMKLYKEQKVNPLSSCLPLLIQFPFLIAVYQAFRHGLESDALNLLYPFVHNPGTINSISFGIVDLAVPSFVLAILAGLGQYVQTRMLITKKGPQKSKGAKDENMMASMNKSMQYFMPFMTVIIGMRFPGGLALYWLVTTVLTVLQQKLIFSKQLKPATANPAVREQRGEVIPPKAGNDKQIEENKN
jgi:YidC/Oxa1 family membrane protein insertase